MTYGMTKEASEHPLAADCVCMLGERSLDTMLDKCRIATSRIIIAVRGLKDVEHKETDGPVKRKIVPVGRLPLHRLEWSKPNRPNIEISYSIPDPRDPERDMLEYEVHLPEGSIHLSNVMTLDMALDIGTFLNDAARQALDRTWKPETSDRNRVETWGMGLNQIVADRLLSDRPTSKARFDMARVVEVMLPTPWSPVMVRMATASGATMEAMPLEDLHDGDDLLRRISAKAPMAIDMIGGGSNRKYVLYVESHHAEGCEDPMQLMRSVGAIMGECR